ncbi:MAG: tetratricopeptide repeat protein [Candidatus Cloacimonetes bacterium]|nr:tetratricopeptide repeat protein [Candidatus Cloacimonadota bacterium]
MNWEKIVSKKLIGKGTFGKVYKVTDEKGTIWALKIIDKQYHKFRIQFKSAFEITMKINDINYVKAYQWLSDKDVSWVMEYVEGKPISALRFSDEFNLDEILKVMIQVCNGLMALHSKNIIHRDLKPQNILLNSNNIIKITDFDFIKIEQTGKQMSQFIGTPAYSSPEHFISSYDLDIRSDLYSLGVILYELVTGKLPIEGKDAKEIGDKHRLKPIILPTKINPLIPEGVEKIITGLLEKNPKDRYQHAHAVAMDLFKEIKNKKGIKVKEDIPYLLKPRFVNRVISLKTLNELSDELESKNGKVVLVLGESGIGKSKLIQQFYHYLQFQNVDFYYSVCKLVEHSFEPLSSIFEEILSAKTETKKRKYFGKFGWDLIKFGILAEKEWMNKIEKPVELSGKSAEIRLFNTMTNFIQKAAAKPLVICIDDLQWADEIILKWLIYAERNLKEFPVLIVGLHRTEQLIEDSLILKIENLIQIRINNLKCVDVSDMIRSMLGKKSSSKELDNFIKSIITHTKGNPLFIREILYYLQEKKKITIENNKWKFPLDPEIKDLPSDIHMIILERIHELSSETLITLQTASVIGKQFSFEMLMYMTKKSDNELLDDLIDCREVSLIEGSGNDYIFIHDKVREVVENEVKEKYPSFWKELHLKAGEFLEEKYSSNPDEVLDDMANHYLVAGIRDKSVKYCQLAGDKAGDRFIFNKALYYYGYVKQIISKERKSINKNEQEYTELSNRLFDVQINIIDIFRWTGQWEKALENAEFTLKMAEDLNDKKYLAIALNKIGLQYFYKGLYREAMEIFRRYLTIDRKIGFELGKSTAYANMGIIHLNQGDLKKALTCFENELKIVRKLGNIREESFAYGYIGNVYFGYGNLTKACEYYNKKLHIAEKSGDKLAICEVLGDIGSIFFRKGNYDKAMDYYKKNLIIAEEIGYKRRISVAVGLMGNVHFVRGEYEKARKCYNQKMKIAEALDEKLSIINSSLSMGKIHYYQKEYRRALEYYERAISLTNEMELWIKLPYIILQKAKIKYELKEYENALKFSQKADHLAYKMKNEVRIFECKLMKIKILFKTTINRELKIKNCIEPLEELLEQVKDEEQIAEINYELAVMYSEFKKKTEVEKHIKKGISLYEKLYKKTPKFEYKNKMECLQNLN